MYWSIETEKFERYDAECAFVNASPWSPMTLYYYSGITTKSPINGSKFMTLLTLNKHFRNYGIFRKCLFLLNNSLKAKKNDNFFKNFASKWRNLLLNSGIQMISTSSSKLSFEPISASSIFWSPMPQELWTLSKCHDLYRHLRLRRLWQWGQTGRFNLAVPFTWTVYRSGHLWKESKKRYTLLVIDSLRIAGKVEIEVCRPLVHSRKCSLLFQNLAYNCLLNS